MYFVKYENPEGEHLKVAKAEAPPQPPLLGHAWCIRKERADANCWGCFAGAKGATP